MDSMVMVNKAGAQRTVNTAAELVRARFDGFTKDAGSDPVKAHRKALQERAKAAGIDARQSNEDLEAALAELDDSDTPAGHREAAGDANPAPVDSPIA